MLENFGWTILWEWITYKNRHQTSQWCEECSCFVQGGPSFKVQIWVSITDIFGIFLSSWRDDVFNYATSAAFQILSTLITPPPFDAPSRGNVVKEINIVGKTVFCIAVFMFVNILTNFVKGEINQAKREINGAHNVVIKS
jgi:hypothetical protein